MIYFLRHGLDDERFVGGWSNIDLIEEGKEQVKNTIKQIKEKKLPIKKVIVSDVLRAKTTAKMVCDELNIKEYIIDSNLNEQNKGILNGMDKKQAKKEYLMYTGNNVLIDTVFPEGESLVDLYNRVNVYLDKILEFEDDTLIVTHRGVINMIYYILNDIELDMDKERFNVDHASVHVLDKNNKTIKRII